MFFNLKEHGESWFIQMLQRFKEPCEFYADDTESFVGVYTIPTGSMSMLWRGDFHLSAQERCYSFFESELSKSSWKPGVRIKHDGMTYQFSHKEPYDQLPGVLYTVVLSQCD